MFLLFTETLGSHPKHHVAPEGTDALSFLPRTLSLAVTIIDHVSLSSTYMYHLNSFPTES